MPVFERAPSLTLTDYLVQEISRKIFLGELRPGERLRATAIAQEVGVSRGPVREAIQRLQEQGLVTYAPNRGVWVMELSIEDIQDVLDVRVILEGSAARLAAPHFGEADAAALSVIIAQMQQVVDQGSFMDLIPIDINFHRTLSEMSGNRRLSHLIALLNVQARPHMAAGHLLGEDAHDIPSDHQKVLDALCTQDSDMAERAIREHIYGTNRPFIERLQEQRRNVNRDGAYGVGVFITTPN